MDNLVGSRCFTGEVRARGTKRLVLGPAAVCRDRDPKAELLTPGTGSLCSNTHTRPLRVHVCVHVCAHMTCFLKPIHMSVSANNSERNTSLKYETVTV